MLKTFEIGVGITEVRLEAAPSCANATASKLVRAARRSTSAQLAGTITVLTWSVDLSSASRAALTCE
jgi:hypothetical protein